MDASSQDDRIMDDEMDGAHMGELRNYKENCG
jgi:hypothetical protein